MQLVVLILVAVVLLEDRIAVDPASSTSPEAAAPAWLALATAVIPPLLLLLIQWRIVRRTERGMDTRSPDAPRDFHRADAVMGLVPWISLLSTAAATLLLDWLPAVRRTVGNWPAIDELLALLPALTSMAASWRIHEPLERRLRDAARVRNLDEGLPLPEWTSPTRYVIGRIRSNILLLLAPILVVVAISEIVEPSVARAWPAFWEAGGREGVTLGIAGTVYFFSPFLARIILQLESLPPGELREDLDRVCKGCGVRVRDILVWRTEHGMVNGAVMGLLAPVRYVMLTDGLLELLPRNELKAVMAHEIGHVRQRHLPWMLAMLIVLLTGASLAIEWPASEIDAFIRQAEWDGERKLNALLWLDRGATLFAGGLTLLAFGWISRRVERQADSFAVQFLSNEANSPAVTPDSVVAMSGALGSVARFAGVSRERRSWRHGSIGWRQDYLATVVGMPVSALPIDRLVRLLKWGTAIALLALALAVVRDLKRGAAGANGNPASGYDGTVAGRS